MPLHGSLLPTAVVRCRTYVVGFSWIFFQRQIQPGSASALKDLRVSVPRINFPGLIQARPSISHSLLKYFSIKKPPGGGFWINIMSGFAKLL